MRNCSLARSARTILTQKFPKFDGGRGNFPVKLLDFRKWYEETNIVYYKACQKIQCCEAPVNSLYIPVDVLAQKRPERSRFELWQWYLHRRIPTNKHAGCTILEFHDTNQKDSGITALLRCKEHMDIIRLIIQCFLPTQTQEVRVWARNIVHGVKQNQ